MTSSLTSLESFFGGLTAEVAAKTARLNRMSTKESNEGDVKDVIDSIEKAVEECQEMLEQMEIEIRGLSDKTSREKCLRRWESYSAELRRLIQDYRTAKQNRERIDLMGDENDEDDFAIISVENDHQQRLIENTDRIERSGRKLNQGHELLNETESIGAAVLSDLQIQRETIQKSRNRLRDTGDDLRSSSKVLGLMLNRATMGQVILFGVGVVIGLLVVIFIIKFVT